MWINIWAAPKASAQPSDRFPHSTTTFIDGVRYEAFDLGGFTELLRIDADLAAATQENALLHEQITAYQEEVAQLHIVVDSLQEDVTVLQHERTRLIERWSEENRLRLLAENQPDITEGLAWGLSAALGVATLVLAIVLGVSGV